MHPRPSRFRFLPFALFAATLFLSVKVGVVWHGLEGMIAGSVSMADAFASRRRTPRTRSR